jgi:hypothetical protein
MPEVHSQLMRALYYMLMISPVLPVLNPGLWGADWPRIK